MRVAVFECILSELYGQLLSSIIFVHHQIQELEI